MDGRQSVPDHEKKKKRNGSGFIFYAIFVFTALGAGLIVILMRSQS